MCVRPERIPHCGDIGHAAFRTRAPLDHPLFVPRLRPLALEALRRPGTVEFGAEQLVHEHAHAKVVVEELVVPVVRGSAGVWRERVRQMRGSRARCPRRERVLRAGRECVRCTGGCAVAKRTQPNRQPNPQPQH
eukprot:7377472-Prymnesium_polylepis.2